ncbi:hypothetical protein BZG02_07320 [Labilibaculum filiforme]|uniref:DNA lyase n=1 Tax=Labilibaculum filiforme TaxID=1940526 RepID=A0A2N3I0H3_9BACT|nr:pyrimidine dimer DNA glycosylase/endonuclease V [Labilibaculum filiforme]PKQ63825.1 hypothetical protein BZG02_07320 [Labilibaculum filiforme]
MRIWSIHPKYLDTKGLVALWRETLLAKNVLEGKTKGYKNHPQLIRFKNLEDPLHGINQYLEAVYEEACIRGYHFNKEKFVLYEEPLKVNVTTGQIEFEKQHLLRKLEQRDKERYFKMLEEKNIETHLLFKVGKGDIEEWEIV